MAGICRILISYDVGCQWYKYLQARLDSYFGFPPFQLADLEYWKVAVPKFHLSGHGTDCQVLFNLACTKWAGRMDGERIEGGWAQTIGMATWTRESGPYARRNILDDHWNANNWGKLLGLRKFWLFLTPQLSLTPLLGTLLYKNLRRSLVWSKSQRKVATLVSESYLPTTVDEWRKMRDEFDLDQSKPNPYEEVDNRACSFNNYLILSDQSPDVTLAELKLELLKEEAREQVGHGPSPKVSPGAFFRKAIEIEDRRYVSESTA